MIFLLSKINKWAKRITKNSQFRNWKINWSNLGWLFWVRKLNWFKESCGQVTMRQCFLGKDRVKRKKTAKVMSTKVKMSKSENIYKPIGSMYWYAEDEQLLLCNGTRHHFCLLRESMFFVKLFIFLMSWFDVCITPVDVSNVLKLYDYIQKLKWTCTYRNLKLDPNNTKTKYYLPKGS